MVVPWPFTVSDDAVRLNTNGSCAFCETFHFPWGSAGKESAYNAGDLGSVSGLGRSPGEGKGYPLQYSGLENPMDSIVHGVMKSQTQLSNSLSPAVIRSLFLMSMSLFLFCK